MNKTPLVCEQIKLTHYNTDALKEACKVMKVSFEGITAHYVAAISKKTGYKTTVTKKKGRYQVEIWKV